MPVQWLIMLVLMGKTWEPVSPPLIPPRRLPSMFALVHVDQDPHQIRSVMRYLLLLLILSVSMLAQTSHSVALTWVDTSNPTGTTYNVKRATGTCSGTPAFSTIASAV